MIKTRFRFPLQGLILLGFLSLTTTSLKAQLVVSGSETLVNTTTTNNQISPAIAMDTAGNYVIVWASFSEDGDDYGVYAQIYNQGGTASGGQIHVSSTYTLEGQRNPDVCMAANGNFWVVWQDGGNDGDGLGVYKRGYDITGTQIAATTRVNSTTANDQQLPKIACDQAGNHTVVWMSELTDGDDFGVYRRRYNNTGVALESQVLVNTTTTGYQGYPDISVDSSGDAVIVWQINDGTSNQINAQLYDNTGAVTVSEFAVNTTTTNNQQEPAVSMDNNGNFMVVWSSMAQDGDHYGIIGRVYNAAGTAQTAEVQVNTTTAGTQDNAAVSATEEGDFVVTWTGYGSDGDKGGVYGQMIDATGSFLDGEVLINTRTTDYQQMPDVAVYDTSYACVVVWQDGLRNSATTHDGDDYGIYHQAFMVTDTTDPIAVCQNINVYLDGSGSITINPSDVDGGSTDNVGVASLLLSNNSFTCADIGANVVTLTVLDAAGNSDACNATVTVADTTSPTAICQNITLYLDGTGNGTITASDLDGGSTDNCGINTYSASQTAFTCSDAGANVVALTVTDASGNFSSCNATVTVLDTVSPSAVCQNLNVYLDGTGNATVTAADVDNGSTDNCSVVSYSLTQTAFTCADIGTNAVTLTVTDGSGNTDNCAATITILDTVSPSAVCQNINVYLDGTGNATITAADVDGGSSDNCAVASTSIDVSSFTCADVGANLVTLTVMDASANSSACVATVTVADTTSPAVACQNVTVYLDGTGNASITTADVDAGSSDNCGTPSLSLSATSFTCADIGANSVTLTATDASSNSSNCTATVTVMDTVSPAAVCQNITVYLDGTGNATITAADVDGGSTDNCSIASSTIDVSSFTCADLGANTVNLTVTDGSSNSGVCTAIVTVADTTSPSAVCQNVTVYLDGAGNATITASDIDGGSTDNCSTVTLSASQTAFTCADAGANVVTLTVTDGSGNSSNCNATVTVADTTSPTAVCQDVTVYLDGSGNATVAATDVDNGSTDNCGTPTLSLDVTAFTCADIGANTVTLTASDGTNASNCTATVTVMDTVSPAAVCQNITVYLDGTGNATITAADVDGGSTDNCSIASSTIDVSSFTCADLGANTVNLTVTDGSSNSGVCTAIVTVADTTSPSAVCQNVTVYLDGAGNATITASDIDGGSTDNCSTVTLSASQTAFTCADAGANVVTLTVTDGSGNSSNCNATVTVADTTSPTAVCQDVTVYLDGSGNATVAATDVDNGSTDNCGTPTLSLDVTAFTCADIGANTVTLTASDGTNASNCTATVTVMDTVSPAAVCQNITVYLDGTGNATITAADVDGGSTDNCSIASSTIDFSSFTCADVGANTVNLTVTDGSSNSSVCTATVTVADTTSPSAVCQDVTVYLDGTGNATITTSDVDNGSTDNCGTPSLSLDVTSFTCADAGANTVVLTATDGSSNTSSCTATVTVMDTLLPAVMCQNINVYLDSTGNASISASDVDGGTTDNCGTPSLTIDVNTFNCANVGGNTVILTATDGSGNVDSCTATITVMDTIGPAVSCMDITVQLDSTGNASIVASDVNAGSSDSCGIDTMTVSITNFTCADLGANTVSLDVTDVNGNVSSCSATVTVADTISPWFTNCPGDTTFSSNAGGCEGVFTWTAPTENDNCASPTVTSTHNSGDSFPLGTTNVIYTVTDAAGNSETCSFNVTVINDLDIVLDSVDHALCNSDSNGVAYVTVMGGSPTYLFDWDIDGMGDNDDMEDQGGLAAGVHQVVVTDANGCTDTATAIINEPVALAAVVTAQSDPSVCGLSDGSIDVDVSGGTTPYSYDWNAGAYTTEDLAGIPAGLYNLLVTDTNGCTANVSVGLSDPGAATVVVDSVHHVTCFGGNDGAAFISVSGGLTPYTYDWNNDGVGDFDDLEDQTGLSAGSYIVAVQEGSGCIATLQIQIQEPAAITTAPVITDVSCNGLSDGMVVLNATGGTGPLTEDWGTADPLLLPAGSHLYTITDSVGCTYTDSVLVTEPSVLMASSNVTNVSCNGLADGAITVTPTGGTPGYSISWATSDSTMMIDSLMAGTYVYTVTDTNGCLYTDSATVVEPVAIALSATTVDESGAGSNGQIDLTVTGGTPGFTYDWDNDGTGDNDDTQDLAGLVGGTYMVTVIDTNGCQDTLTVIVNSTVDAPELTSGDFGFNLYPNPSTGSFMIELNKHSNGVVQVFDVIGKLIYEDQLAGSDRMQIDLNYVHSGTYYVRVVDGDNSATKRVVIER